MNVALNAAWSSALATLFLGAAIAAEGPVLAAEETGLNADEVRMLQAVTRYDKEFRTSKRVMRYFRVDPATGTKLPVRVELVFPRRDGLVFGEFNSYSVSFEPDLSVVNYAFDAGTAWRGGGTVLVGSGSVVRSQTTCGTDGCSVEVRRNGKLLYKDKAPR